MDLMMVGGIICIAIVVVVMAALAKYINGSPDTSGGGKPEETSEKKISETKASGQKGSGKGKKK